MSQSEEQKPETPKPRPKKVFSRSLSTVPSSTRERPPIQPTTTQSSPQHHHSRFYKPRPMKVFNRSMSMAGHYTPASIISGIIQCSEPTTEMIQGQLSPSWKQEMINRSMQSSPMGSIEKAQSKEMKSIGLQYSPVSSFDKSSPAMSPQNQSIWSIRSLVDSSSDAKVKSVSVESGSCDSWINPKPQPAKLQRQQSELLTIEQLSMITGGKILTEELLKKGHRPSKDKPPQISVSSHDETSKQEEELNQHSPDHESEIERQQGLWKKAAKGITIMRHFLKAEDQDKQEESLWQPIHNKASSRRIQPPSDRLGRLKQIHKVATIDDDDGDEGPLIIIPGMQRKKTIRPKEKALQASKENREQAAQLGISPERMARFRLAIEQTKRVLAERRRAQGIPQPPSPVKVAPGKKSRTSWKWAAKMLSTEESIDENKPRVNWKWVKKLSTEDCVDGNREEKSFMRAKSEQVFRTSPKRKPKRQTTDPAVVSHWRKARMSAKLISALGQSKNRSKGSNSSNSSSFGSNASFDDGSKRGSMDKEGDDIKRAQKVENKLKRSGSRIYKNVIKRGSSQQGAEDVKPQSEGESSPGMKTRLFQKSINASKEEAKALKHYRKFKKKISQSPEDEDTPPSPISLVPKRIPRRHKFGAASSLQQRRDSGMLPELPLKSKSLNPEPTLTSLEEDIISEGEEHSDDCSNETEQEEPSAGRATRFKKKSEHTAEKYKTWSNLERTHSSDDILEEKVEDDPIDQLDQTYVSRQNSGTARALQKGRGRKTSGTHISVDMFQQLHRSMSQDVESDTSEDAFEPEPEETTTREKKVGSRRSSVAQMEKDNLDSVSPTSEDNESRKCIQVQAHIHQEQKLLSRRGTPKSTPTTPVDLGKFDWWPEGDPDDEDISSQTKDEWEKIATNKPETLKINTDLVTTVSFRKKPGAMGLSPQLQKAKARGQTTVSQGKDDRSLLELPAESGTPTTPTSALNISIESIRSNISFSKLTDLFGSISNPGSAAQSPVAERKLTAPPLFPPPCKPSIPEKKATPPARKMTPTSPLATSSVTKSPITETPTATPIPTRSLLQRRLSETALSAFSIFSSATTLENEESSDTEDEAVSSPSHFARAASMPASIINARKQKQQQKKPAPGTGTSFIGAALAATIPFGQNSFGMVPSNDPGTLSVQTPKLNLRRQSEGLMSMYTVHKIKKGHERNVNRRRKTLAYVEKYKLPSPKHSRLNMFHRKQKPKPKPGSFIASAIAQAMPIPMNIGAFNDDDSKTGKMLRRESTALANTYPLTRKNQGKSAQPSFLQQALGAVLPMPVADPTSAAVKKRRQSIATMDNILANPKETTGRRRRSEGILARAGRGIVKKRSTWKNPFKRKKKKKSALQSLLNQSATSTQAQIAFKMFQLMT